MMPQASDTRKTLCRICKRYKIHNLCIGRHSKSEHNQHHLHFRSLHSYVAKNVKCTVTVF